MESFSWFPYPSHSTSSGAGELKQDTGTTETADLGRGLRCKHLQHPATVRLVLEKLHLLLPNAKRVYVKMKNLSRSNKSYGRNLHDS